MEERMREKLRFTRVAAKRMYEAVVEQIEGMIQRGELAAGDVLPSERDMAAMLGVSRGVLSQAFRVLEENGVIEVRPGYGRVVRAVRADDATDVLRELEKAAILDLLEARETVERTIVELACQRATDADLGEIERIVQAWKREELDVDTDQEFHLAVARATHNVVLTNMLRLTLGLLRKTRERTLQVPGRKQRMVEEHNAIYQAIVARNPEAAREAVARHLNSIRSHLS
jgi:GntR family transcriptional repressor for pyruvate dehydrogenase complex